MRAGVLGVWVFHERELAEAPWSKCVGLLEAMGRLTEPGATDGVDRVARRGVE